MTRDRIITALAAAAVASGLLVALSADDLGNRPADSRKHRKHESKLVELDGGKAYAYPTDLEDGGVEFVITTDPPCVRRPAGAPVSSCLRREPDGGARDFGDLNRFPAEEAVGAGCQGVACSIVLGEDSLEDEDVRLTREKAKRK